MREYGISKLNKKMVCIIIITNIIIGARWLINSVIVLGIYF